MKGEPRSTQFRPGPDTVAERLDDELVLIHMKTDRIYLLNRTGARIWELLSGGHDVTEIERRVRGEFEVAQDEVAVEIQGLLESLQSERLITPVD